MEAPMLDLEALAFLAAVYESANMLGISAELRRGLKWYRSKVVKGEEDVMKMMKPLLGGLSIVELSKGYQ